MEQALALLELSGTIVFAVSGALAAARKQMDLFGFVVLATVTGIGGGTLRDLLLGRHPVGWVGQPSVVLLCGATAVLTFGLVPKLEARSSALLWADAVGLAVFAVTGTRTALEAGAPAVSAIALGMLTAAGGGMVRDVLAGEIPLVLRREIYALAAILGGAAYWALAELSLPTGPAMVLACLLAFGLRALGLRFGLSLPAYRGRPDHPAGA